MAARSGLSVLGLCLAMARLLVAAAGLLNVQELHEMKYGIEILSEPVIRGQSKSDDVVIVSSKYKQLYECRLPAQAMKFQQDSEDEGQSYSGLGVSELLKPMDAAPCLIKTKDWWTYEFCYGQYIKQYHIEDSEVKGEVLYLGIYEAEFDWENETAKASKQHKLKRYHSQTYVNGSKCDLNEKPREAEVRFLCEEGSGDYLSRVDEPQSCSYVLTVHTTRLCHHPYLRSPVASKPQPIKCQPALSPEQYVEYVKAQMSDTKRKVEKISEELKTLDEMLLKDQPDQTEEGDAQSLEATEGESLTAEEQGESREGTLWVDDGVPSDSQEIEEEETEEEFWDSDRKQEARDGATSQEEGNEEAEPAEQEEGDNLDDNPGEQGKQKIKFRLIRNPEDLVKFVRELKKQNKKRKGEDQDLTPEQPLADTEEQTPSTLERLEQGLDGDEGQLLEDFEKQLQDVTLPKSKMSEIKREVKEEMEKEIATLIDEAEGELEAEGLKGEFDRNQATKSLASTLNKLIEKLETEEEEEEEDDPARGSPGRSPKPVPEADEEREGHVKVRVTKINPGSSQHKEMRVREMSGTDPQLRQIENVVKEQLEKAGLKAEGKIEVKIVTTGSLGDDDDLHWLSEEDTKSFRELLINLLTGSNDEVSREQERQQQLEDNYRFVWGTSQEDAQSTSATDSEDMDF